MATQSLLASHGYEVITAGDGVSALNYIHRDMPLLVVSDVVLPSMSGHHLCRLLKNDPLTDHLPVVLMSSLDQKSDRFWGLEAGADLYLEKQSGPGPILDAVEQVLLEAGPAPDGTEAIHQRRIASFSDFSATARLNALLDQLLFELTVRSAVRGPARAARGQPELRVALFELLERVFDYDVAALVVQSPQDIQIAFDLQTPLTSHDLHALCDAIQDRLTPGIAGQQTLNVELVKPEMVHDHVPSLVFHSHLQTRLEVDENHQGAIILYSTQANAYGQETRSIMKYVSDELQYALHSLVKTEEIEQLKADFTAMLVHDLRSPLTTILGFTELVLADQEEPLSPSQRDRIERVHRKGRSMLALVNDILELSRLEAGRLILELSWLDITSLLERVHRDMVVLANEGGLTLNLQVGSSLPSVRADERRLERVLVNLLSNAIKFTPEGGLVTIRVWHHAERGSPDASSHVFISITDTGHGISRDKAKLLFDKYQLAADGHQHVGTGLGLAICKEIVEAHQGRIWLQSQVGEGTTVSLVLPVDGQVEAAASVTGKAEEVVVY
jgi:signal transduction histidine kinase/CheY-like chemotaxis protein